MTSIITGLFKSQSQAPRIAADFKSAGIKKSHYIFYLHEHPIRKEIKTSIWRYFFNDRAVLEDDSLVVSVKAKTPERIEKVKGIFCGHDCMLQNYFEHIKFKDAKSLEYLKRIASIRAKAQIFHIPETHHHLSHEGMGTEVNFGKL